MRTFVGDIHDIPNYMNIKKILPLLLAAAPVCGGYAAATPDSLFVYSPGERDGAHVAIVSNGTLTEVGQIFSSDYSQWGSQKRMHNLFVAALPTGGYAAVFGVNDYAPCFAVAYSDDMVTWRPQDYPRMSVKGCLAPVIKYNGDGTYTVLFKTKDGKVRKTKTQKDFRHFSADTEATAAEYDEAAQDVVRNVGGKEMTGQMLPATSGQTDAIKKHFEWLAADGARSAENLAEDAKRFASLGNEVKASLTVNGKERKAISDKLIGIFFEDISYAADGGLYAEMVQNRDFEYTSADRREWNAATAWRTSSADGQLDIRTDAPLSTANPHYAVLTQDTLYNSGWDGMTVTAGADYLFSIRVRNIGGKAKKMTVALMDGNKTIATAKLKTKGKDGVWNTYEAVLTPTASADKAQLALVPEKKNEVAVDMISLFPKETFKGRRNGLRKDLAETLANLKPKFVRFPGGCMSHGDGLDNIYHWNHTVGPLEDRKPDRNIWNYHQTRGLGFYEYFQFCEDIGAEPLPVLAAGVPCQNSSADKDGYGGQQGGIPMSQMLAYIQEILDMIEWANGNPATSKWAKMRADAGHPAPFNLKYVGIGNEDIISTDFEDRCLMICKAIKERYPEIEVCGTVGPFHYPSSDYVEGWKYANDNKSVFDLVDEHYYESVGWFLNHQHYYDNYDRTAPKVYLGEYAARQGMGGIDCALAEAAYLCHVERNADVVSMTSYAPLLSKNGHSNWSPDMIYFDNKNIDTTVSYETQRLFSVYSGNEYVSSTLQVDSALQNRVAASVVTDSRTGKTYLKVVNILPATLRLQVSLGGIAPAGSTLTMEGFAGKPGQQKAEKLNGKVSVQADGKVTLALKPYSFCVYEL